MPGYLPIHNDPRLAELLRRNCIELVGADAFEGPRDTVEGVSGDIGDVGHLMPTVLGFARGWSGHAHTADYSVESEEIAYLLLAKAMAMTVVDLLVDDAAQAQSLLQEHAPRMTKQEYLGFLRGLFARTDFPPSGRSSDTG